MCMFGTEAFDAILCNPSGSGVDRSLREKLACTSVRFLSYLHSHILQISPVHAGQNALFLHRFLSLGFSSQPPKVCYHASPCHATRPARLSHNIHRMSTVQVSTSHRLDILQRAAVSRDVSLTLHYEDGCFHK